MANELQGLSMNLDARRVAALMEECFRCVEGMPKRGAALEWGVQWLARQGGAISFKSVERKFYAWLNSGKNQLAVVDRRRVLGKNTGKGIHNPAFVAYWVALAAEYQRSVRSAYNELRLRGAVIGGFCRKGEVGVDALAGECFLQQRARPLHIHHIGDGGGGAGYQLAE